VKLKAAAPQKAAAPVKTSVAATKKSANAVAAKAKEYYEAVGCYFGNSLDYAIKGDYSANFTLLGMLANVGIGLIPIAGQAADIRDFVHAVTHTKERTFLGNVGNISINIIAFIPLLGDAAKQLKYADEVADVIKQIDNADNAIAGFVKNADELFDGVGDAAKGVCFVAGTLIMTRSGYRAIETIATGDFVFSYNPKTGESGYKEVTRSFVHETVEAVTVTIGGNKIITTPDHPFWIVGVGWTEAKNLRPGYLLFLSNGETATVEALNIETLVEPLTVYNFEVADWHTYFVGSDAVLVHNSCKVDIKQINDAARAAGLTSEQRRLFGDLIEDIKRVAGKGGAINFTYQELLEIAREIAEGN
jgi:hypothetical protein